MRCPICQGVLTSAQLPEIALGCLKCNETFPVVNGIPRMISAAMRQALGGENSPAGPGQIDRMRVDTAKSFGFEWSRFPEMRAEWENNFWDYMLPHTPESFRGKRVLDAGCGSGRHAFYAAKNGAEVWAIDIGSAVEVAKRNNQRNDNVHVAQADLHHLPFEPGSFDLVYSIGVLHHLPDPESAFRNLLRYLKPGGWIHIYLYWRPENQPVKSAILALIRAIRRVTTRIPHRLVYGLSFPVAAAAFAGFVWPYQALVAAGLNGIAERMPMKQYAKYPFRVCVNDQFDRLSAPIEFRYTRDEVEGWLRSARLEEIVIRPNYGWCATGRKPVNGA
ncbi:MAG: methyltransferase domain-containing protein [Blastocatellia bacterium]